MNVFKNIKDLRLFLGMTQVELAKALRMTQPGISLYELGRRPSKRSRARIDKFCAKRNIKLEL